MLCCRACVCSAAPLLTALPPSPAVQPPLERYTQLLSLSVMANINAALCERHLAKCPPSDELAQQCALAAKLDAATDDALAAMEASTAEPLCKDM